MRCWLLSSRRLGAADGKGDSLAWVGWREGDANFAACWLRSCCCCWGLLLLRLFIPSSWWGTSLLLDTRVTLLCTARVASCSRVGLSTAGTRVAVLRLGVLLLVGCERVESSALGWSVALCLRRRRLTTPENLCGLESWDLGSESTSRREGVGVRIERTCVGVHGWLGGRGIQSG